MSQSAKRLFLASFLMMGTWKKTLIPDQMRVRVLAPAMDEKEMRILIQPVAEGLGASFVLEPIEVVDDVSKLSANIRRQCESQGFVLAVMSNQQEASQ